MPGAGNDRVQRAPANMASVLIRRAVPSDARDIADLVLLSAERFLPAVFGNRIRPALCRLARGSRTLFSHIHAQTAVQGSEATGGAVQGALLGYAGSEKAAEDPATGLALFLALGPGLLARLGKLLILQRTIGKLAADEWYVSNVAVYPEHRGRGIGTTLMAAGEEEAVRSGCARIVLDVETDHEPAIALYRSLGYAVERETGPLPIGGMVFSFLRMAKPVAGPASED